MGCGAAGPVPNSASTPPIVLPLMASDTAESIISSLAKVLLRVIERRNDHLLHLFIGQAICWLHFDLRFLAAALFESADVQDAIRVDEEFHLDARHSCGHRRYSFQIESCQRPAVARQFTLPLQHVDSDIRLTFHGGGEMLCSGGGNRGVAMNDLRHHTAHGFDP